MIRPVLRPDDPAVTAYALGELSGAERADVESAAAADPAVRAAIDEATAAAGVLTVALKQELSSDAGPVLDSAQRAAILERAASGAPILSLTSRLRRWGLFAATAAAVMAGAFLITSQPILKITDISSVGRDASSGTDTGGAGRIAIKDGDSIISGISGATHRPPPSGLTPAREGELQRERFRLEAILRANPGTEAGAESHLSPGFGGASGPVRVVVPGVPRPQVPTGGGGGAGGGFVDLTSSKKITVLGGIDPQSAPGQATDANWNGNYRFLNPQGRSILPGLREPSDPRPRPDVTDAEYAPDRSTKQAEARAGTESYRAYVESAFVLPKGASALSTFSIDVDTASYANVRRMLNEGHLPAADSVRVEELMNYFPYAYAAPAESDPFAVHLEVAGCPWNAKHRLVRIGIKGKDVAKKERPASNLVFLLDVSGSMNAPNKLPLVKASLRMLVDELNERDTVSIVVYAGASGLALAPTSCEKKNTILEAIDKLVPSGSTNGAAGIELAYQTAAASFIAGGVNRVVLCTDGDFNVGTVSHDGLLSLVTEKAKSKVFLTALGFGMGNYKDDTLELLADKGNGNYGYIDSTREAHKVLVEHSSGTLVTIAKDVKLQVEFNPATVAAYRLVGYDNRLLAAKDFNDDTKDAGEIGAGHTVTAFYEIVPVGVELPVVAEQPATVDPLKYQQPGVPPAPAPVVTLPLPPLTPDPAQGTVPVILFPPVYSPTVASPDLLTVKLRWKAPEGDVSTKKEFPLVDSGTTYDKATPDFQFASSVAAFALLLKQSPYRGTANFDAVLEIAGSSLGNDPGGWRAEFVDLVKKAKALSPTK